MKKPKRAKLRLDKQTIADLTPDTLRRIGGGNMDADGTGPRPCSTEPSCVQCGGTAYQCPSLVTCGSVCTWFFC